tara:strand:+ start:6796 stop:8823 length:2028 start_codon:yes stop_codon:yes gene_type:complete
MQSSKRPKTPPAPERLRQTTINSFRSVVRIVDGVTSNKNASSQKVSSGESMGVLDIIADDSIVRILEFILTIDDTNARGIPYLRAAEETRKTAVSFALTCHRVYSVMESIAAPQKAEILARGSTKITPFYRSTEYPFTQQMRSELLSCDQMKMLQKALRSMACHCSKACCARYQHGFNKDVQKGKIFSRPSSPRTTPTTPPTYTEFRLTTVFESCSLLAPCSDGKSAFAYVRRRVQNRQGNHGDGRGKRHEDCIIRVVQKKDKHDKTCFVQSHVAVMEFDDVSQPLTMRTSRDGKMVAFICSMHEGDGSDQMPYSVVYYWNTLDPDKGPLAIKGEGRQRDCVSPQDAWFLEHDTSVHDTAGAEWLHDYSRDHAPSPGFRAMSGHNSTVEDLNYKLVVAWSSSFVHNSGHTIGQALQYHTHYKFDIFEEDEHEDRPLEVCDSGGISQDHFLVSCSPSEDGSLVLALVKNNNHEFGFRRLTYIHDIVNDTSSLVPHSCASSTSKGPLCASLSRTGDCIVSLHKTNKSMVMDVMVCNSKSDHLYTPVQTVDLTPFLALHPRDNTATNMNTDLVKACYEFVFSPCGRFVSVVDRRPLFGEAPCNHGVVIVDMAMRMEHSITKRGLKTIPMFATEDQAPRSFHWTDSGIWLQPPGTDENGSTGPRGGAMCLYAPTTVSFS